MKSISMSLSALCLVVLTGCVSHRGAELSAMQDELRIVIMDPLCTQLACACVDGYAQRNYEALAVFLRKTLRRPVSLSYVESISSVHEWMPATSDIIIGKHSEVMTDARQMKLPVHTIAALTGLDGAITQTGLFVVKQNSSAESIEDIIPEKLLLGPEDSDEKSFAARASLEAFGISAKRLGGSKSSCNAAAVAVVEGDAQAAVISSYAKPLLSGCGVTDKGDLKTIGSTDEVPFVCVFGTRNLAKQEEAAFLSVLLQANRANHVRLALESRDGFVALPPLTDDWPDWRGALRDGRTDAMPTILPKQLTPLWNRTLTGDCMSGLSVGGGKVIVADKSLDSNHDIFRCLDADSGREIWKLSYPAAGRMDFSNSPRATPVISGGLVYLLGAFGELRCAELATGKVRWRMNMLAEYGAELPQWGCSSTPLVVGDKLIINPGAESASLVALNRLTGKTVWKTSGGLAAYASFIYGTFGGRHQVVGYDAVSLSGWDDETGKRLWSVTPEEDGDFNVPTPLVIGEYLFVATENNFARLYAFDANGVIKTKPLFVCKDFAPDTSTPVYINGKIYGFDGALRCLDVSKGLSLTWSNDEDRYQDYCSLMAGNGRALVVTKSGTLNLLDAGAEDYRCISSVDLFNNEGDQDLDVWSHPVVVGRRLYIRNNLQIHCFLFQGSGEQ